MAQITVKASHIIRTATEAQNIWGKLHDVVDVWRRNEVKKFWKKYRRSSSYSTRLRDELHFVYGWKWVRPTPLRLLKSYNPVEYQFFEERVEKRKSYLLRLEERTNRLLATARKAQSKVGTQIVLIDDSEVELLIWLRMMIDGGTKKYYQVLLDSESN